LPHQNAESSSEPAVNLGEHLGIWLALLVASAGLVAWNISRLRIVRPTLDRLVAVIGSAAILMVVIGASLVITEVTECTLSTTCNNRDVLLVAIIDFSVAAALISQWLRADVCHVAARVVRIPATRRR
jgi:hypothetical protein